MDKFTLYFIFFIAFCVNDVLCKRRSHKKEDGGKIVGGTETTIQNYPHQVFLLLNNGRDNFQCGGSIISPNYIVTAAHCLAGIRSIQIRIASTDAFSGGLQYNASSFRSHPMYDEDTYDYDIGIVTVSQGMNLDGTNAKAISLARVGSDVAGGEMVTVTGWGATSEGGPTTSILNVVTVPAVNRAACNEQLGGSVTRTMFCAGLPEGGKDSCQGDSGGPAVVNGTQVGTVSYGFGCARPNSPGVYCRIGHPVVRSFITMRTGV